VYESCRIFFDEEIPKKIQINNPDFHHTTVCSNEINMWFLSNADQLQAVYSSWANGNDKCPNVTSVVN
jgi:hypothetical protein